MSKLTTDVLLKESIKSILTELVNSTYDWQEYTDSEISDILEISDEQALELSKIINDNVKANNKLWSSNKIDSELQNMIIEANKYSDELIGQISSISLEYVTVLPDTDIKSNVIYILQGNPNTLNVYNNSTSAFVTVGDLNIDLTNYYTKSEVDAELAKKANADEVLKPDAIVSDLTTTSGTTTLSTAGLKTELDKKIDKTAISTSISSTSTDEEVASAKCINDNYGIKTFTKLEQLGLTEGSETLEGIIGAMPEQSVFSYSVTTNSNTSIYPKQDGMLIINKQGDWRVNLTFYSDSISEQWIGYYQKSSGMQAFRRVCTTSVSDVPLTTVPLDSSKFSNGHLQYEVKNGTCYVYINALNAKATFLGYNMSSTPMPKPSSGLATAPIVSDSNGVIIGLFHVDVSFNSTPRCHIFTTSLNGYVTFSYPVAES